MKATHSVMITKSVPAHEMQDVLLSELEVLSNKARKPERYRWLDEPEWQNMRQEAVTNILATLKRRTNDFVVPLNKGRTYTARCYVNNAFSRQLAGISRQVIREKEKIVFVDCDSEVIELCPEQDEVESRINVDQFLESLPELDRSVVVDRLKGYKWKECAKRAGLEVWQLLEQRRRIEESFKAFFC